MYCEGDAEDGTPSSQLVLIEGQVLGGGAFSRVSKVTDEATIPPEDGLPPKVQPRHYALKRMRKATVLQCPEHVFCEQVITKNAAHPFCIRQVRALLLANTPRPPSAIT